MQIKTTMSHHLTPVRMAIIKKFTNCKCWRGYGENRTLLDCWWECKLASHCWRMVWSFLKKLKRKFPGGSVVKTPYFQCRDADLIPGQGAKILTKKPWGQKV